MTVIDKHPMRLRIVDALMSGESARQIASWAIPKVGHATIGRFKLEVLKTAVATLRPGSSNGNVVNEIAEAAGLKGDRVEGEKALQGRLRQELQARVSGRLSRRERWLSDAEAIPVRHPETGEVIAKSMDHKALAAHDRNEGSDVEFLARLGGLMHEAGTTNTIVQTVVMLPPAAPAGQAPQVVEIDLTK